MSAKRGAAVAARYLVEGFDRFGGKHCVTASLAKYLAYLRRPFSESMLLGLGGGIGFNFREDTFGEIEFNTRFSGSRPLDFETGLLARIGSEAEWLEFDIVEEGHSALLMQLEIGEPAMLYADIGELPHFGRPFGAHFGGHALLVYAADEEVAWISDCCEVPVLIPLDRLMAARFSDCGSTSPRGRMLRLTLPLRSVDHEQSIRTAIARTCRHLLSEAPASCGLAALERWPATIQTWIDFGPGLLFGRLRAIHDQIEIAGTGGGAFRKLYSEFLCECARLLNSASLREAQELYILSAMAWTDVARAALSPDDPILSRVCRLIEERARLFVTQASPQRMHEIAAEVEDAAYEWTAAPAASRADTLKALSVAARHCATAEKVAARALDNCGS